jgi:hypothetical protein
MESIFLILSGVILLAGVLYWFWSHIQLTQKKVQLLENSIFELRDTLSKLPGGRGGGGGSGGSPVDPVYEDLNDDAEEAVQEEVAEAAAEEDDWDDEAPAGASVAAALSPKRDVFVSRMGAQEELVDDLAPGGRMSGTLDGLEELPESASASASTGDEFRNLFVSEPVAPASASRTPESLESMSVKELRRLADQRGISGAADMRKKEILAALRQQVAPAPAPATVTVERTVDLVEVEAEAEAVVEAVSADAEADGELKELTLE